MNEHERSLIVNKEFPAGFVKSVFKRRICHLYLESKIDVQFRLWVTLDEA